MWRSVSVAALASLLAGCGGELPAPTQARPACVPRDDSHASICGLAPPLRRVDDGTAYALTTVVGEHFSVVLPDELAPPSRVVAVPRVPIGVNADLTTAAPHEAADRHCHGFPRCEPAVVDRVAVPSGVMTRWDDVSGTIRDLGVTTVDLGGWTLVMLEPDATRAARIGRALEWSVDLDRYPRVAPDRRVYAEWAGVALWLPGLEARDVVVEIIPGCGTKQPDLGGADAGPDLELHAPETVVGGRWCADGRYSVDVSFAGRPLLERLHEGLRIVPSIE